MKKIFAVVVSVLACALSFYIGLMGVMYLNQRSFLYFPDHALPNVAETGIGNIQDIYVTTKDGLKIHGWYLPSAYDDGSVVVYFHGNGSTIQSSIHSMADYIKAGYGILMVEYRGYSGNPGALSEEGIYNDSRAFLAWLKEQGVPESRTVLHGTSLGTGVAVQMAVEHEPFQAIVLESPYTSMTDIGATQYPFIPVRILLKDRYDSYSKIENIKSPLVVVHGKKDTLVPYASGLKLFEKAPQPKTLITLEDAGHNDMGNFGSAAKIISALSE